MLARPQPRPLYGVHPFTYWKLGPLYDSTEYYYSILSILIIHVLQQVVTYFWFETECITGNCYLLYDVEYTLWPLRSIGN